MYFVPIQQLSNAGAGNFNRHSGNTYLGSLLSHAHALTTFVTSDVSVLLLTLKLPAPLQHPWFIPNLTTVTHSTSTFQHTISPNSRSSKTTWPEQSHPNANLTTSHLHFAHFTGSR